MQPSANKPCLGKPMNGWFSSLLRSVIVLAFIVIVQLTTAIAGPLNVTIYDSHPHQVHYYPERICERFWFFPCWNSYNPWKPFYWSDRPGLVSSVHESVNHPSVQMSIDFHGSAIWIFGSGRRSLPVAVADYKACVHKFMGEKPECFRVNMTEAYLNAMDDDSYVLIFAMGNLPHTDHRILISLADSADEASPSIGITFTHAVYTVERPTPWPVNEDNWRFRTVVMHDTHPEVQFSPSSSVCERSFLGFCSSYVSWAPKWFTSPDGSVTSYHLLETTNPSGSSIWSATATFKAGSVALYGVPKHDIDQNLRPTPLCVRIDHGLCENIDMEHPYLNADNNDESILLWYSHALNPERDTHLSIHAASVGGSGGPRGFAFQRIEYGEEKEYSSPFPSTGTPRNVCVDHSHYDVKYAPGKRCTRRFMWWCTGWFEAWWWRTVGPESAPRTYHRTLAGHRVTEDPYVSFSFQGSAVYVYGAPRYTMSQLPKAHQRLCLDDRCMDIDITQAYLNAPRVHDSQFTSYATSDTTEEPSGRQVQSDNVSLDTNGTLFANGWIDPELEPVLLYYMDGLDEQRQHTIELRLAAESDPYEARMTLSKIVYTQVTYEYGRSRPPSPLPAPYPPPPPAFPPHAIRWTPRPSPTPLPTTTPSSLAVILCVILAAYGFCVTFLLAATFFKKRDTFFVKSVRNYSAISDHQPQTSNERIWSPPPPYKP